MKTLGKNIAFSLSSLIIFFSLLEIIFSSFGSVTYFNLPPYLQEIYDWPEYKTYIKISSQGLRDREFSLAKPAGTYRILSVGDSFSFGKGVKTEEIYAKLLEKKLNTAYPGRKFEVINAGVPGAGPHQYLENIEKLGPIFQPDMIIVGFYTGNDFQDVFRNKEKKSSMSLLTKLSTFLEHNFHLYCLLKKIRNYRRFRVKRELFYWRFPRKKGKPLNEEIKKAVYKEIFQGKTTPSMESAWEKAKKVFEVDSALVKQMHQALFWDPDTPVMQAAMLNTFQLIRKMRDKSIEQGAEFLLTVIPVHLQVDSIYSAFYSRFVAPLRENEPRTEKTRRQLADFCRGQGIEHLDLLPALRKNKEIITYYLLDGHWNQAGHKLATEEIYRFIRPRFSSSSRLGEISP